MEISLLCDLKVVARYGEGERFFLLTRKEMVFTREDLKYATRHTSPLLRV